MKRLMIGAALGVALLAGCNKQAEVVYTPAPTVTVESTPAPTHTAEGARQRALLERAWNAIGLSQQQEICYLWNLDRNAGIQLVIENPIPDVTLEDTIRFFDGKC